MQFTLNQVFIVEEVIRAINQMKCLAATGSDGFPALFFY